MPVAQTVHPGASRYPRWPSEASLADGYWADFMARFADGVFDPRITHTRASTATYIDRDGYLRTAAINSPRITYDPVTLACRGYLHEAQATNLYLNSAVGVTQSITVAATPNTLSFYGTGTITLTGVSTAGPLVGTGANNRVQLTFTPTAGSLTLTVSGSCTLVQLEANPAATSYIPTAGSAVPRAADIAYIDVATHLAGLSPTNFTVFCEVQALMTNDYPRVIGTQDANDSIIDVANATEIGTWDQSIYQTVNGPSVVSAPRKMAASGRVGARTIALAGSRADAISNALDPLTSLRIGGAGMFAASLFTGIYKSLRVWKRGFSAAETEALTE